MKVEVEDTIEIRVKRSENSIRTLQWTQDAMLDRMDKNFNLLKETRDIAADNRARLDGIGIQLEAVNNRLDRLEQTTAENRVILTAIGKFHGLTYELPGNDS